MRHLTLFIFLFHLFSCTQRKPEQFFDVTLAFGYKDTRPTRFVGDRYEKIYLVSKLIKPCPVAVGDEGACGFVRDEDDMFLLTKKMMNKAGENVSMRLRILSSSIGPDDEINRKSSYQKYISAKAEYFFLESLKTDDVIIYLGHSRDGGGPDFSPPKMTTAKHVDYPWYRKTQPGLNKIKSQIKLLVTDRAKRLTLLSCNSDTYFNAKSLSAPGKLKVQTTDGLIYFKDALEAALKEISLAIKQVRTSDRDR